MLKTSLIKFIFVNIACISCFFKFLNSFFVFSKWNGPQALYINPGCFKCISGINLSPANKNLLSISLIFICCLQIVCFRHVRIQVSIHIQWNCIQNKISPNIGTLLNSVLILKLLSSPFASWFLINLDFLLPHIAHFDHIIALPLLLLEIFWSMFSASFLHFKWFHFYTFHLQLVSVRHVLTYLHVLLIILLHLNISHKILKNFSLKSLTLYVACN